MKLWKSYADIIIPDTYKFMIFVIIDTADKVYFRYKF